VLFDRADDLCVEVMPARLGRPAGVFDGPPAGLDPGPAGPDRPVPGGPPGGWVAWVAFDRVAPTLVDAVVSGVRDLDAAGLATDAAIADDSIVTLETIAERLDRPVAAVRAWELPGPVFAHPRRPVYDWTEVAEWLAARLGYTPRDEEPTMAAVNLTLRVRALGPRLERMTPLRSLLHR
jgi:hypothetical protein